MSQVSDERLIVAAVKGGDCEAMELLKDRVQSEVRSFLERAAHRNGTEIEDIESQVLPQELQEEVQRRILTQVHQYRFVRSFQGWVQTLILNASFEYQRNNRQSSNRKPESKKSLPKVPPALNRPSIQAKLPPLEDIDLEIRSLVVLLNESPHIQTTCSCSGHPNQKAWKTRGWNPFGGWIHIEPTRDPRYALDFIVSMLKSLDNTTVLKTTNGVRQDDGASANFIPQHYYEADAEELFYSDAPVVVIGVDLSLFAHHQEATHRLQIWRRFIDSIRDLITDKKKLCPEIDTPEMASRYLREELCRLPSIYSVELRTDRDGYPGLHLYTKGDLALCQWFSELANRIYLFQGKTAYWEADAEGQAQFVAKWGFTLQPWLDAELIPLPHLIKYHWEPRTREDHLKIWKLIELAVAEQIH